MKFYLIDDDKNVLHILKRIIRDRGLGEIAGTAENGVDALTDLPLINPDIVIVDLLMPEIDGITFVKRARSYAPDLTFIMLSQVASKDMIADAYSAGIEFYIHKPINSIEVESILRKVSESLTARRTLQQVQTIFQTQQNFVQPQGFINDTAEKPYIIRLKGILQKLGITGESGSTWISYQGTDQSGGFAGGKKCVLSVCEKVFKCDRMQLCDRRIFYGVGSTVSKHNRAG